MEVMNPSWPATAPLFHYHITRFEDGGADAQGCLYLNRALQSLTIKGICRADLHHPPYTEAGAKAKPSAAAYADAAGRALGRRGPRVRFVPSSGLSHVAWIREQLNQDRPAVVGILLPTEYRRSVPDKRSQWLDPDASPLSGTGHCLLATGYDDLRQVIHLLDCHGPAQFEHGYWWMGYRVVDSSVVQELYALFP
jgi:hypothetical protein